MENLSRIMEALEAVEESCPYKGAHDVEVWKSAFDHARATIAALAVAKHNEPDRTAPVDENPDGLPNRWRN